MPDPEVDSFIPGTGPTTATPPTTPAAAVRPSFDDVLRLLGDPGRFQLVQVALALHTQLVMAFMSMSFVFLGFEPPHVCNAMNETRLLEDHGLLNDSTATVHFRACDLAISSNDSGGEKDVLVTSCPSGRNFSDKKLTTWLSEWDLVCEVRGQAELTYSAYQVGMIVGGLLASTIADRYGRRIVLLVSYFCCFCSEASIILAPNIYIIIAIRALSGVFRSGVGATYQVLCVELIIPKHRESCGVFMCVLWIFQMLSMGAVGYVFQDSDWRYFQGGVAASALLSLVYPFLIYESPRWLTTKQQYGDALKVLQSACKLSGKDFREVKSLYLKCVAEKNGYNTETPEEFMMAQVADDSTDNVNDDWTAHIKDGSENSKASLLTLLCHKDLLVLTLSVTFITFANNITYHGLYMTSSSLVGNRFLNYCFMCLAEFPSTALMYVMMKRMGRLIVIRFFLCMTWMTLLASSLLMTFGGDTPGTKTATTVMFMFGLFAITSSYSMAIIIRPELFPTNLRSTGSAFVSSMSRLGTLLVPFFRPFMTRYKWGPAAIFTGVSSLALLLTFFMPETKDKELLDSVSELRSTMREKKRRH